MSPPPSDPRPPGSDDPPRPGAPPPPRSNVRRAITIAVGVAVVVAFIAASTLGGDDDDGDITYSEFRAQVRDGLVASIEIDDRSGVIHGEYRQSPGASALSAPETFETRAAKGPLPDTDIALLEERGVAYTFHHEASNPIGSVIIWLLPIVAIIAIIVWLGRRSQGQMASIMNIGRTRAKVYTTERPRTTFDDVAGYSAVKEEIQEVVDFLKHPGKFTDLGAKIPKGVLLVGRRAPARRCWPGPSPGRRGSRSSR
jgi:cell division protease FtsH